MNVCTLMHTTTMHRWVTEQLVYLSAHHVEVPNKSWNITGMGCDAINPMPVHANVMKLVPLRTRQFFFTCIDD